jgi:spermidine/putrescine transport system substrate-binding protein
VGERRPDDWLESWAQGGDLTRRKLLVRAGGGALALSGTASLIAACGSDDSSSGGASSVASGGQGEGVGGIPIASKQHPVTLPLFDDNPAIESGLNPEAGPLVIFDWSEYLSPAVVKSFEEKFGVEVKLTNYASFQESLGKITSGAITPDVWVPIVERLPQLVAAKLIQPLNRDYIPNLTGVLSALENPYYDQGSQYTAANYIWTTGVLWRQDLLPDVDPGALDNPWDVFWSTPDTNGRIGLQNAEAFDPLSLGLLRNGVTDFTSLNQDQVDEAQASLEELTAQGAKFQYTGFEEIASGKELLAQAWSGDAFVAPAFLAPGTPASTIQYWFPEDGVGSVNNDFWSVPKSSEHPVLGHMFINHLLEADQAIENYTTVGYQAPLKDMTLDLLKQRKVNDPDLLDMIFITDAAADNGLPNPTPTPEQLKSYEAAFSALTSGA